jgi:hypothetical protein
MNPSQTASALAPREFILLCSYLDAHYGPQTKFEVLSVERNLEGLVSEVQLVIPGGERLTIDAAKVRRAA